MGTQLVMKRTRQHASSRRSSTCSMESWSANGSTASSAENKSRASQIRTMRQQLVVAPSGGQMDGSRTVSRHHLRRKLLGNSLGSSALLRSDSVEERLIEAVSGATDYPVERVASLLRQKCRPRTSRVVMVEA